VSSIALFLVIPFLRTGGGGEDEGKVNRGGEYRRVLAGEDYWKRRGTQNTEGKGKGGKKNCPSNQLPQKQNHVHSHRSLFSFSFSLPSLHLFTANHQPTLPPLLVKLQRVSSMQLKPSIK
jgi:hypothetical protein